jgi:hypothetical protein
MVGNISLDDFVELQHLVGKYMWLVDAGDSEGFAALWTEDGVLSGATTAPFAGHEALKQVPAGVKSGWNGALRHHAGSLSASYGATRDEAIVRFYTLVTTWNEVQPKLFGFGVSEMQVARRSREWKIKSNAVTMLVPSRALGDAS